MIKLVPLTNTTTTWEEPDEFKEENYRMLYGMYGELLNLEEPITKQIWLASPRIKALIRKHKPILMPALIELLTMAAGKGLDIRLYPSFQRSRTSKQYKPVDVWGRVMYRSGGRGHLSLWLNSKGEQVGTFDVLGSLLDLGDYDNQYEL